MTFTPGTQLRSASSLCEVVVVRPPDTDGTITCAGAEMTTDTDIDRSGAATDGPAIALGKRYTEEASGIELLCVKPGVGPLAFNGAELELKSAKPLPASD